MKQTKAITDAKDYLSQLKMYLRTRRNQNIQNPVSKAILICWENKDMLNEDETELRFSNDVRVEVWELADKGDTLKNLGIKKSFNQKLVLMNRFKNINEES